jgi:hypothetical protein
VPLTERDFAYALTIAIALLVLGILIALVTMR